MKTREFLVGGVLGALLLSQVPPVQSQRDQAALAKQSSIVFVGTVLKLGAVSFPGVPTSAQTIVVRVDSVLHKPPAVSLKKGDRVTVEAKDPAAFHPGMQATFYTDGWIFGAGVAVKELEHEIAPTSLSAGAVTEREANFRQMQKQASDQELRNRIQAADAVVVGRVLEVHPWTPSGLAATKPRVSEHDPNWQEAVIKVQSAIKGAKPEQKMVVRFPGSYDVAWANAPKFKKDQQGTFFLKTDQVTGAPKARLAGAKVNAYTALKPADVLSATEEARIRSLLKQ